MRVQQKSAHCGDHSSLGVLTGATSSQPLAQRGKQPKKCEECRRAFADRADLHSAECDRSIRAGPCKKSKSMKFQASVGKPELRQTTPRAYLFSVELRSQSGPDRRNEPIQIGRASC